MFQFGEAFRFVVREFFYNQGFQTGIVVTILWYSVSQKHRTEKLKENVEALARKVGDQKLDCASCPLVKIEDAVRMDSHEVGKAQQPADEHARGSHDE